MSSQGPMMMLSREYGEFERLARRVRFGRGGTLVVRGEAGSGKTTLLARSLDFAQGCRVVRIAGVGAERGLAFAAIQRLCEQLWEGFERLPEPQADALKSVLGLTVARTPDNLLVGLAVRSLLAEAADPRPLVCIIDDAQWLDAPSAQALAFVARRLDSVPVALIVAVREQCAELGGLPEVELEGLSPVEARWLVDRALPGPLEDELRARIVLETQGNPVAVADTLRQLSPVAVAGGFGSPAAIALPIALEQSLLRMLDALADDDARLLLLLAAAEPLGRPHLLWRAADALSIPVTAGRQLGAAGWLRFGAVVGFRHPAMRTAVYRAASSDDRRRVHAALAEVTDPASDPARRAWHRGEATSSPDESVAAELERAAGSAKAKGGLMAAAAVLDRAAALTPDPQCRSRRMFAAGRATFAAGASDQALELLARAEPQRFETRERAQLEQLLVEVVVSQHGGRDAPELLLSAAKRLSPMEAELSRDTYLAALRAAIEVGHLGNARGLAEAAAAAAAASLPREPVRAADLLLDGLTALLGGGDEVAVPMLNRALRALGVESETRWDSLGANIAADLWDDATARALASRQQEVALRDGAMSDLRQSLSTLAVLSVHAGDLVAAADQIERAYSALTEPADAGMSCASLMLAALRGAEAEAAEIIETTVEYAAARGEGRVIAFAEEMTAVLHNSLGNYPDALSAAQRASEHGQFGVSDRALAELIEAAVRCGQPDVAGVALARLSARTRMSGTDWALGIEARSRALLSQSHTADLLYRTAIDRLGRCSVTTALARAHLLYGEWLRREGQRGEARRQLHTALQMFTTMGARGFTERTERELVASGERLHKAPVELSTQLTSQEAQISRLARDGHSNPEIAAKLFISPRTVEYHLRKVFMKLGIRSRNELHRILDPGDAQLLTARPDLSSPQRNVPR